MSRGKENKERDSSFKDKLIQAKRVSKTVKGGRKFSFSGLVVIGNGKGLVGYGAGKSNEVSDARKKALEVSKKNLLKVPIYQNRTIHYDVEGKFGASKVIIRKAKPGTGIIAGSAMRSVFELLGIRDVVAKSLGSSTPCNLIGATFNALSKLVHPKYIAAKRGKILSEILVPNPKYVVNSSLESGDSVSK